MVICLVFGKKTFDKIEMALQFIRLINIKFQTITQLDVYKLKLDKNNIRYIQAEIRQ